MTSKVVGLREAVAANVHDGDTLAIEGFTHLISFAAAHEVIRQGLRDLTLARLTPDLDYDQMVAAGCAAKLVFSWLGNPGVGSLHAIRRAIEAGQLEIEEYSHHGMVARYAAGASRLPFPLRSYDAATLPGPSADPAVAHPMTPRRIRGPPLNPTSRSSTPNAPSRGHVQAWGSSVCSARRPSPHDASSQWARASSIVVRDDPDRPCCRDRVDAVCVEPFGEHPSFAQGHYDRDNAFYRDWDPSAAIRRLEAWLESGAGPRREAAYVERMGAAKVDKLRPTRAPREASTRELR